MPVRKVKGPRGGTGYRYGTSGKYYTGAGAKERAIRQGVAIKISQQKKKK